MNTSQKISGLLAECRFNPTAEKICELTRAVGSASSLEREHALMEHTMGLLASLKAVKESQLTMAIAEEAETQPQEAMTCH